MVEAPPAEGDAGSWTLEPGQVAGRDLARPFVVLQDATTVLLNLPGVKEYAVLDVRLEGEVLHIVTDLPDALEHNLLAGWGPEGERENFRVLRLGSPVAREVSPRLLTCGGREVALALTLAEAIRAARDHSAADLGPSVWSLCFLEGREGLHYVIDCSDGQTINRDGTAAVAGRFVVDARTGAVVDCNLRVHPLAGTRYLVKNGDFLTWLDAGTALVLAGREEQRLEGLNAGSEVVFSHPLEARGWSFRGVGDGTACFETADGWMEVDLASGAVCRLAAPPEGMREPEEARPLEVRDGERGLAVVALDGREFRVDLESLGDFRELRRGAWSEVTGKLYFSTEIEGPRYGIWVTEYRLWELDPVTGVVREVTALPVPRFSLSPDGGHAVYLYSGNSSIVTLR